MHLLNLRHTPNNECPQGLEEEGAKEDANTGYGSEWLAS
jgi:hypothetical protein